MPFQTKRTMRAYFPTFPPQSFSHFIRVHQCFHLKFSLHCMIIWLFRSIIFVVPEHILKNCLASADLSITSRAGSGMVVIVKAYISKGIQAMSINALVFISFFHYLHQTYQEDTVLLILLLNLKANFVSLALELRFYAIALLICCWALLL